MVVFWQAFWQACVVQKLRQRIYIILDEQINIQTNDFNHSYDMKKDTFSVSSFSVLSNDRKWMNRNQVKDVQSKFMFTFGDMNNSMIMSETT